MPQVFSKASSSTGIQLGMCFQLFDTHEAFCTIVLTTL